MSERPRGFKGLSRNLFDPSGQMLSRRGLFCVEIHLSWQVVSPRWLFVPNPLLMSRESRGRESRGGSLSGTKRRGEEFGGSVRSCNEHIGTNTPGGAPSEKRPCQVRPPMTRVPRRRWAPVTCWWSHRQPIVGMWRSKLQRWIFITQSHASIDQWKCMLPYAYKPA